MKNHPKAKNPTKHRGFWDNLEYPLIGLAPMDGVTDAAFRFMVSTHSRPSVMFTEFTNVEGLSRGAVKLLDAFSWSETERPIVAQVYGVEVKSFYKAALVVAALGFDGIDINMGCPANSVARKGSGAGLIRTPALAQTIVQKVQQAMSDWANGIALERGGIHPDIIKIIRQRCPTSSPRKQLPVSIKTRIGYDTVVTESWIKTLLEVRPANISLHGRTLKQLYSGSADWEEIGKAALITRGTQTTLLGNGDIQSLEDAHLKIKTYGVDGVLVGRAAWGNPWFFKGVQPTKEEGLAAALEHGAYLEQHCPQTPFRHFRKHLVWYCRDFPGARELRAELMQIETYEALKKCIAKTSIIRQCHLIPSNNSA